MSLLTGGLLKPTNLTLMAIQILREHTAMPWANGSGITYEVARFPENDDFDWRVSLAEVEQDGPFSVMPGIDRTLVLLEGDSITLVSQEEAVQLKELELYDFPGEREIECKLSVGLARDLNIMTRRTSFTSKTELVGTNPHKIDASKGTHILVCLRGQLTVDGEVLNYRDAAIISGNVEVTSTGTFAHITFSAV